VIYLPAEANTSPRNTNVTALHHPPAILQKKRDSGVNERRRGVRGRRRRGMRKIMSGGEKEKDRTLETEVEEETVATTKTDEKNLTKNRENTVEAEAILKISQLNIKVSSQPISLRSLSLSHHPLKFPLLPRKTKGKQIWTSTLQTKKLAPNPSVNLKTPRNSMSAHTVVPSSAAKVAPWQLSFKITPTPASPVVVKSV
jgi:hypothetical protein